MLDPQATLQITIFSPQHDRSEAERLCDQEPLGAVDRIDGDCASSSRIPPARRPDLMFRPIGDDGEHVVKDPRTGGFFKLGPVESFLLSRLDGRQSATAIAAAFEVQFGEPLSGDDLDDFLNLARQQGFLRPDVEPTPDVGNGHESAEVDEARFRPKSGRRPEPSGRGPASPDEPAPAAPRLRRRQSLLYWRASLFDPDRLFNRLEPHLRFVWTRGFLLLSSAAIAVAVWLVWTERQALVSQFPHALRWETLVLAWLTVIAITTCHEFAHGLTCKHYGGEVHEIGFLLMYGLPCFFCNVSDAWLFREKAKRLWVTLAGAYCDLVLWALAVFAWRLTMPDCLQNYVAWVALSILGVRVFFNINPLLKLDGYYLLSDWLDVPNLRQRAWDSWMEAVRWGLWGAPRPVRQPRGRFLVCFGAACWLYVFFMLGLIMASAWGLIVVRGGWIGASWLGLLGMTMARGQFRGAAGGEVSEMIRSRPKRTAAWVVVVGVLPAVFASGQLEDRVGGSFRVRPVRRAEVRAPVAGFLCEVRADEGDRISPGEPFARLEVPDLESRIAQKQAERRESQARLRLLEIGPRPEEVEAQRQRIGRSTAWRDLARRDLDRAEQVLAGDLARLDEQLVQHRAEWEQVRATLARMQKLRGRSPGTVSEEEYREVETKCRVSQAQADQVEAEKRARRAQGTIEAETELALREKQLAEAQAVLALLEAGTRPEDVDAERARSARLEEELRYQEGLRARLAIVSPVSGLIVTPRLREKIGQYFREGDLIGEVESQASLEAEITLDEHDADRVWTGQSVALKARALPFRTFRGRVDRIAPVAIPGELQSTLTAYCRLEKPVPELRPGMTGYARISVGRRSLGEIVAGRVLRVLRTEFWW